MRGKKFFHLLLKLAADKMNLFSLSLFFYSFSFFFAKLYYQLISFAKNIYIHSACVQLKQIRIRDKQTHAKTRFLFYFCEVTFPNANNN